MPPRPASRTTRPGTPIFGRFPDHKRPESESIEIAIAAYTDEGAEHVETFRFAGRAKLAASLVVAQNVDEDGQISVAVVLSWLSKQIVAEDRERFEALLISDEWDVEQSTLVEVYQALTSKYAEGRPTR